MIKLFDKRANAYIFILLFLCLFFSGAKAQGNSPGQMKVHFINVGQADAELLEFSCGAVLIDAGAQDPNTLQGLLKYLHSFFARRTDLNNTLDLVIISHDHIDHDTALLAVAQNFNIKNYIDNGHTSGSGEKNQGWMEQHAKASGIPYESFSFEQITNSGNHKGLTDNIVDPIHCSVVNPQITILSGRFEKNPGWGSADFKQENNHSIVVRVQFGKSTFLFTGDLQGAAENKLAAYYGNNGLLHADVWKVSHHGANNGTGKTWLSAVTPKYAVISCGVWNYGQGPPVKTFSTFAYGHPRKVTLDTLQQFITGNRPQPISVEAATAQFKFVNYTVTRNVYATAWDGNVTITATDNGDYTIVTNDQ